MSCYIQSSRLRGKLNFFVLENITNSKLQKKRHRLSKTFSPAILVTRFLCLQVLVFLEFYVNGALNLNWILKHFYDEITI